MAQKIEKLTPSWLRTNDARGHEPRDFKPRCNYHPDAVAFLRYSRIAIDEKNGYFLNKQGWKCGQCGGIELFNIRTDKDYFHHLVKIRRGRAFWVPDTREWANEDEEIKKRLESLGYV